MAIKALFYLCFFVLLLATSTKCVYGQPVSERARRHTGLEIRTAPPETTAETNAYCTAICEYIKAVYKSGVPRPDTLFIGKNADMPDIEMPHTLQGINTVLLTSKEAERKLSYRKSLVYLNVVGWLDTEPEFIIVTFYEFKPQHNCSIHFKRNSGHGQMDLESLTFQYPYGQKK